MLLQSISWLSFNFSHLRHPPVFQSENLGSKWVSSEESLSKGRVGGGQLLLPDHLLLLTSSWNFLSLQDQNLSPRFCERLMKEVSKKALHEKEKEPKEDSHLIRYCYFLHPFLISKFLWTWITPWFSFTKTWTIRPSFGIGSSCSCFLSENMGGSEKEWKN